MSNSMISNEPLGKQLVFTAKAVREAFEEALARAGGSLGTWVVLSALSHEGVISQAAQGNNAEQFSGPHIMPVKYREQRPMVAMMTSVEPRAFMPLASA